jgi:very-short-patch-repair endonuclease
MDAPEVTHVRAKALRRRMDLPEVVLWAALRGRQLDGLKFRRQHPLGPYVLDFYCHEAKLAVEVDGYSHDVEDRPRRDAIRDAFVAERGVRTLRVLAVDVLKNLDSVVSTIAAAAKG